MTTADHTPLHGRRVTQPVTRACPQCGATDDLVAVEPWNAGDPPDWYCQDVMACYDRGRAANGLPI